jgi:sugar lactone lactonase YvrE
MKKPTCVAFGGPNMNKLFITSAKDINSNEDDASGKTICIQMNVKGQLSNRYILNL